MNPERDQVVDPRWHALQRDGTRLVCADYGGTGAPVLLLHGLGGHATEWNQTASWLTKTHRVFAPDLRGHGRSERHPQDCSRSAHVDDVAAWIERLDIRPTALVGQSLGGHTAFLVAARHPDIVEKLVVVEAAPGSATDGEALSADDETLTHVRRWLASWPVPFASRDEAAAFFGRNDTWAKAWADGLEQRKDGLHPSFDIDVMVETLAVAAGSYWDEWRSIQCPLLLVVAANRPDPALAHRMIAEQPRARLSEVGDAGHDLHLDNPAAWQDVLEAFLS